MRKPVLIILQAVIMLGSFCLLSFAEDGAKIVNQANSLYRQKKYDEAIKLYNQAQIKSPDSSEINYNIGIAQYKKGDYNLAVNFLEKATFSKDKILESKANFNIANSKYKLGRLKENTELKETVSLLRQSLDYYKRAIELNSQDQDAKINHELVEKELKILLDKLKQEQNKEVQEQDQSQGKKEQQEKGGADTEQVKQQQAASDQEQKAQEQKKEEAKERKEIKQAEEQKENQGKEPKDQVLEEAKDMSKEEANMLLEGYRQEENSAGKLEDKKKGNVGEVLKDW